MSGVLVYLQRLVAVVFEDFPKGAKADMGVHRIEALKEPPHVHRDGLVLVEHFKDHENHLSFFGVNRLSALVAMHVLKEGDAVHPGDGADESLGKLRMSLAEFLQPVELLVERSVR